MLFANISESTVVLVCKYSHATAAPRFKHSFYKSFVAAMFVEADRVECKVNVPISITYSTDFIYLVRVSLKVGLSGFDVARNKLLLSDLVTSLYFHRTNICIFIDWKFYFSHMELTTSSF